MSKIYLMNEEKVFKNFLIIFFFGGKLKTMTDNFLFDLSFVGI